jgi:hypothetical protein
LFLLLKAVVLSKAISSQLEKPLALQSAGVSQAYCGNIKKAINTKNWLPAIKQQFLSFKRILSQI